MCIRDRFNELTRLDGRFEQYSKSLFSRAGSEQNRELMDREANAKLDQQIEGYLRLLSGYYLNPAATKTLEYLIRRYKIHVHNVDAAVTCALPYHSTPEFVKLVQLCVLENTSFYWLKGVKETGAAPPRDRLVQRSLRDMAFFSFVADTAATAASQKVSVPPLVTSRATPRVCLILAAARHPPLFLPSDAAAIRGSHHAATD